VIKRIFGLFVATFVIMSLTGCGEVVSPGYKAKMLSSDGFSGDILEPGRHSVWWREELVVLETSTQTMSIPLTVKMADELELKFNINFRTRVNGKDTVLNTVFNDIKPIQEEGRHKTISLNQVFAVYGRDVVSNVSRSVVSKYKVSDVSKNYDQINKQLQSQLLEAMKNNPLEVSNVTLADVSWPEIITKAIESQQERELAIKTEQNQQDIEMVKRTNALRLAQADREIELTKARTLRDQNAITNEGLSDKLIAYKALEVQAMMAENKAAVFVPYEAFGSSGLSNRIMNSK
jgi:regulator of protease activity HflC (stomatin/prohibitin superfamily)